MSRRGQPNGFLQQPARIFGARKMGQRIAAAEARIDLEDARPRRLVHDHWKQSTPRASGSARNDALGQPAENRIALGSALFDFSGPDPQPLVRHRAAQCAALVDEHVDRVFGPTSSCCSIIGSSGAAGRSAGPWRP